MRSRSDDRRGGGLLEALGLVTALVLVVGAALGGLLVAQSLPEVRRYLRMKQM
jgi:hypothetical protein